MDLDPTAVRAAAVALARPGSLPEWLSIPALGRDMTPIAEIAVAAAAPLIARATADAIADKIDSAAAQIETDPDSKCLTLDERDALRVGMWSSAKIARSHGSQAQTTEDGR